MCYHRLNCTVKHDQEDNEDNPQGVVQYLPHAICIYLILLGQNKDKIITIIVPTMLYETKQQLQ